jgi:hypothetical protein
VEADDGVGGEELVGAAGEGEVVAEIGGGVTEVHGRDVETGGNPLIQGGEDTNAELTDEGGLAEEDAGNCCRGAKVGAPPPRRGDYRRSCPR